MTHARMVLAVAWLAVELAGCAARDRVPAVARGGRGDSGPSSTDAAASSADAGREQLLDGSTLEGWQHVGGAAPQWSLVDGALEVNPGSGDLVSTVRHGDVRLHLEFRVPSTPDPNATEQDRGNSGVYLQGRYEVQVLDSFERPLADRNDCGAIYGTRDADSNRALPAEAWQSYDIVFRAPRWEGDVKLAPARISVTWNGVLVHDDVEVQSSTGAGDPEKPAPGPLRLQDHGHRVRYRNLWMQRL